MDEMTMIGLLFGVALFILFGVVTSIALWVVHRAYKFFGGK